jgi:Uncharacterized membrane-anchored protein conserved in bacteria
MNKLMPQPRPDTDFGFTQPAFTPAHSEAAEQMHPVRQLIKRVPDITIYFWIVKLLTTAMGETTSDYLVHQFDPIIVVALAGISLLAMLVVQFWVCRYVAWIYWLTVIMVAIFGTMAADVLHIGLGVPYLVSTILFAAILVAIFVGWYASEKTLSIHSIYIHRRELFYWGTVMATFALGTAIGDMTASTLGLGYLSSGILFAVLFAIPALAYWLFGLNEVLAFWFAYIVTRPLGASFADWMGKTQNLGTGKVSLVLAVLICIFVGYLTITRKDIKKVQA